MPARLVCRARLLVLLTAIAWSPTGCADAPAGDDFRSAAVQYEQRALEAIVDAASDDEHAGRYLQLALAFRQMADIKRRAAALADEGRWNEIDWDEYRELEEHRDRLTQVQ